MILVLSRMVEAGVGFWVQNVPPLSWLLELSGPVVTFLVSDLFMDCLTLWPLFL